jgi:hypothetical protein
VILPIAWQISGTELCIPSLFAFKEYQAVLLIVDAVIIVFILVHFIFCVSHLCLLQNESVSRKINVRMTTNKPKNNRNKLDAYGVQRLTIHGTMLILHRSSSWRDA